MILQPGPSYWSGQRLHEMDTTGFLLSEDPGLWTHPVVRLVAEEDERWVFPISGRVVERKKGASSTTYSLHARRRS